MQPRLSELTPRKQGKNQKPEFVYPCEPFNKFLSSLVGKPSAVPNVSIVVEELMALQAFSVYARRLTHFKEPKNLLTSEGKHDLHWISWGVTQIS